MKKIIFTLSILMGMVHWVSTQTLYAENFDGQNGKGATCACTGQACSTCNICDLSGVTWSFSSAQGSFHDCVVGGMYFRVIADQMQNTWTGNGHPCWESPVIDVSSVNTVEIIINQVKNCGPIAMNFSQRFRIYAVRDGSATIMHEYFGFDFPAGHSVTYTDAPIDVSGVTNFQIRICIVNGGNPQRIWCYDDVSLETVVILPVELTGFSGKANDRSIKLNWQTASELNNFGFEIERSPDGQNWEIIDFVEGNGTTQEDQEYTFLDTRPLPGNNYYRLKQIDFNGQYEYSEVRHVLFNGKPHEVMAIFPNPVADHFSVAVFNPHSQRAHVTLFSSTGQLLWEQKFEEGEMKGHWNKVFTLPQEEMYFVTTQVGDVIETKKVVVIDRR